MKNLKNIIGILALACTLPLASGCDSGGIPLSLVVDEYTMTVNFDEIMNSARSDLQNLGIIGSGNSVLPVLWPESLPEISYNKTFISDPVAIDLTPDPDSEEAAVFGDIADAMKIVKRIDISRLVVRFEVNTMTIATPELAVQIADKKDALAEDRLAWRTIGIIPSKPAGWVGDMDFEFVPSGERYLKAQLMDTEREFAIRLRSTLNLDLQGGSLVPAGKAQIRLILGGTFFLDTLEIINQADELIDNTNE